MKTYKTTTSIDIHQLYQAISEQLPERFDSKRLTQTHVFINETDGNIQIGLPQPYEQYLYKVEVNHNAINVSKSEHYTDDVNSMAMEDVLTDIFLEFVGTDNLDEFKPSVN